MLKEMHVITALILVLITGCSSFDSEPEVSVEAISPAQVEQVTMNEGHDGWEVAVTVRHEDSGWGHYTDWWRITDPDGNEVARRVLRHPHVDEQPFTRSLMNVSIPPDLTQVMVEAHCSVHGTGGDTVTVDLSLAQGPGFTVNRQVRGN